MSAIPDYALTVWFDTYVRPRLPKDEPSVHRESEVLYSRHALDLFTALVDLEGEFDLERNRLRHTIMSTIIDEVLLHGKPVSERFLGRVPSEVELECRKMESSGKGKEKDDGTLGVA